MQLPVKVLFYCFLKLFLGENVLHLHLSLEIPQPTIICLLLESGVPLLSRNLLNYNTTAKALMNQLGLVSLYELIG